MNRLKGFSLKKLLYNKKFSLVISIIVAFIFWLVIAIEQSPERERTLNNLEIDVNTESIWATDDLKLVGELTQTASVTVHGPNYIVSSLKSDDIKVVADLSAVSDAGVVTVNLTPVRNSSESGYDFVSVSPTQISIKLDYYEAEEFQAVPVINNVTRLTDEAYRYENIFAADNSAALSLEIYGFRTDLKKISRVEIVADASELGTITTTTRIADTQLKLYDEDGNLLDSANYELPSGDMSVLVSVSKVVELPVAPTYKNLWNPGIAQALEDCWSVDVESLTLIGPPDKIDAMTSISFVEAIDITEISPKNSDNTFVLIPDLPDGVSILDGVDSVQFTYDMSGFEVRRLKVNLFSHEGSLNANFEPIYPKTVYVEVCATANVLNSLESGDYYLAVDLSDKTDSGVYTVDATFKTYIRKVIWQVVPCSVDITIR